MIPLHAVSGGATVVLSKDTAVSREFVVFCTDDGALRPSADQDYIARFYGGVQRKQFEYLRCFNGAFHGFEHGFSTSMDSWTLEVVVGFFESSFEGESVAPLVESLVVYCRRIPVSTMV